MREASLGRTIRPSRWQDRSQPRLCLVHPFLLDSELRVKEHLDQQAVKEAKHQSGGVVPGLVAAKAEDRGNVRARVGEAAGEAFSDPVVVRRLRECGEVVPRKPHVALAAGRDGVHGEPEPSCGWL